MKDADFLDRVKLIRIKSSPKKSDLCVVVLTYNNVERIEKFLSIMKNQTYSPDTLVIDNSNDRKVIDALRNEELNLISIEGLNVGTSGAFFIGQSIAVSMGYDWILGSDDDAYPDSNFYIEKLLKGTKNSNALVGFGYQKLYGKLIKDDCLGCTAQLSVIHRGVFDRIGYFNPKFWKIMEDIEFKIRLEQYGITTACVKDATYDHPISGGWAVGWPAKFLYYSLRNFMYVKQIHLRNLFGLFAYISTVVYASFTNPKLIKWYWRSCSDFFCNQQYFTNYSVESDLLYPSYSEKTDLKQIKEPLNYVVFLSENPLFLKQNASYLIRSTPFSSLNKDVVFGSGNFLNQFFLLFKKVYIYDPETGALYLIKKRQNLFIDYLLFLFISFISCLIFLPLAFYIILSHFIFGKTLDSELLWQKRATKILLGKMSDEIKVDQNKADPL